VVRIIHFFYKNGGLFATGDNQFGQLGFGHNKDQKEWKQIPKTDKIKQFCCGANHNLFLNSDGEVFVWGHNLYGQLGLGNTEHQNKPRLLMTNMSIAKIASGAYHSLILLENGELHGFGLNMFGQLGLGDTENRTKPQLLMKDRSISVLFNGTLSQITLLSECYAIPYYAKQTLFTFLLCAKQISGKHSLLPLNFILEISKFLGSSPTYISSPPLEVNKELYYPTNVDLPEEYHLPPQKKGYCLIA